MDICRTIEDFSFWITRRWKIINFNSNKNLNDIKIPYAMLSITHIDGLDSHVKSIDDKLRPTSRTTIDLSPHNDESFDTVAMHWPKGDTIAYNACIVRCVYVFSRHYNH